MIEYITPYLKAWVAAVLPLVATVVSDWTGNIEVDGKAWVGSVVFATISWAAVYFAPNTEPETEPTPVKDAGHAAVGGLVTVVLVVLLIIVLLRVV